MLITADGSLRRGSTVRMKATADAALEQAPGVEHVIVWRRLEEDDTPMRAGRDIWWHELIADSPGKLPPLEVDSEAPYLLAYTSGTTGRAQGAPCTSRAASSSRSPARPRTRPTSAPGDRVHFATDMGWIMGPWTVGGGAVGATIVFAEARPTGRTTGSGGSSSRSA